MKKIGIAAILIVMLLTVGVASALAASEKPENATITQIGPDTAKTGDGQILHKFTIKVDNETLIGKRVTGERPEEISITLIGPDTARTSDGQTIKVRTMHVDNMTQSGDHWMIKTSELKTWITNDGHVFKVIFHDINKETPFGTKGGGSRSLAPGIADIWGSYSWTAGQFVSESATWTPANQDVYLGIVDNVRGNGPSALKSGGSGTFSTNVPWTSSDWGYAIANPGPQTIQYTLTF